MGAILAVVLFLEPITARAEPESLPAANSAVVLAPTPRPTTDLHGDPLPAGAVARLGTARLRHLGLADYCLLPDGRSVRTVGRDGFIRTWELASGKLISAVELEGEYGREIGRTQLDRKTEQPTPLKFSADSKLLAAIFTQNVVVWDIKTGRALKNIKCQKAGMEHGLFSPDGKYLALRGSSSVSLLEWRSEREWLVNFPVLRGRPGPRGRPGQETQLQFSPDSHHLMVWNRGNRVETGPFRVYACENLRQMYSFDRNISSCAVSPDNKTLVLGPGDSENVRFLDLASGQEQSKLPVDDWVGSMVYSPDGKILAVENLVRLRGSLITLYDTASQTIVKQIRLKQFVYNLSFSPDGKTIGCNLDYECAVIDVARGEVIQVLGRCDRSEFLENNKLLIGRSEFLADNKRLIGRSDDRLRVWDIASGRELLEPSGDYLLGLIHNPRISIDAKGQLLVAANWISGGVDLWKLDEGRLIRQWNHAECAARQFSLDGKGQTLLRTDMFDPFGHNRVVCCEAETGTVKQIIEWRCQFENQSLIGFSPDHRRAFAIARTEEIHFLAYDLPGGNLLYQTTLPGELDYWTWPNAALRTDTDRGTRISVFSAATGRIRLRIPGFYPKDGALGFSPDGSLLALAGEGHSEVSVREVATGREIASVRPGRIRGVAIAPDNRTLLTTGEAGFRVWDLATGRERLPISTRKMPWNEPKPLCDRHVFVTPDGSRAVAAVADGTGLVWDLSAFISEKLEETREEAELAALWTELMKDDTTAAYKAFWKLADSPAQMVVPFLHGRLKPAAGPDPGLVKNLIAELGDDDFEKREAAHGRLRTFGTLVAPDLREAARSSGLPEIRKRAGELIEKMREPIPSGESLRSIRAVAILERIGTVEAQNALRVLARGAAGARETEEAKSALERLAPRPLK